MSGESVPRKEIDDRFRDVYKAMVLADEKLSNFIQRYEDRYNVIQNQLTETLGVVKSNSTAIATLTQNQKEQLASISKLESFITKVATYNKLLWPIVTIATAAVSLLIGLHIP